MVLASDDVNRANGGPGPGWTVIDSDPQIVNQKVQEPNTQDGNDSIAIYTGRTWPADHYSQVTVLAASLHQGAASQRVVLSGDLSDSAVVKGIPSGRPRVTLTTTLATRQSCK